MFNSSPILNSVVCTDCSMLKQVAPVAQRFDSGNLFKIMSAEIGYTTMMCYNHAAVHTR